MTVATTTNRTVALGNGSTTVFAFDFIIPESGDEQIIYTDASGNSTLLTSSQYTVSGFGNPTGGTVTYPISGSPIASGTTLTIARILPLVQSTSLENQGPYLPQSVESALDYQMMVDQQTSDQSSRALVQPITDVTQIGPLPAEAARANNYLAFNPSGNPIALPGTSADLASLIAYLLALPTQSTPPSPAGTLYWNSTGGGAVLAKS